MKDFFKKIISKNNKWAVASIATVFIIVAILFMPFSQGFLKYISAKISQFATVLSSTLVLGTNNFREVNNENDLVESVLLTNAAQMKADDMASKGYFSHVAPNGDMPWVWFKKVGYTYSYAGENLAVDYTESEDVTTGWINSAKHKANLLNVNFTEIGIGVATGTYQGHQTTFVVQFFGKPYVAQAPKTVAVVNKAVATVKEAEVVVLKPEATTTNTMLASSSPTTAVVTTADLPDGEVLGTETSQNSGNQTTMFAIIGAGLLVIIILIIKIVTLRRERNHY